MIDPQKVETKEDLVEFVIALNENLSVKKDYWQKSSIDSFLELMSC